MCTTALQVEAGMEVSAGVEVGEDDVKYYLNFLFLKRIFVSKFVFFHELIKKGNFQLQAIFFAALFLAPFK